MRVDQLAPSPGSNKAKTRVGRGIGGKGGKTAGRGSKGQGARGTIPARFEGGQTPLHRRTPKARGFNNPFRVEYTAVNLHQLAKLGVADATPEEWRDPADEPQDVQVAGRVVVKEVAFVKAAQAVPCQAARPTPERVEVHLESRTGIDLCDDEAEGKSEREDGDDRADAIPRPGGPRRRVCVPAGPARHAAGHHGMDLPERALRWTAG